MTGRSVWNSTLVRRKPLRRRGAASKPSIAEANGRPKRRPLPRQAKPIARKVRVRLVNPERIRRRRSVQFGSQANLCRKAACYACGASGPCDPHHYPARAAGGTDADTLPLCRGCHAELHTIGLTRFETRHGVFLEDGVKAMRDQVAEEIHAL